MFATIILTGLILVSCKKNNNVLNNKQSEIRIGDYGNMIVNYYDTTLIGGYNSPLEYNIDIDNNGSDDIQFISELWGSPAVGSHPKSTIRCLHPDIQIFGFHINDTSFLNRDTSIQEGPNNTVEIYEIFNYTCHRIDNTDTILQITPSFKISTLERGDILKIDDTFNTDTIVLIDDWYSYPPTLIGENGDTTFYEYKKYYNDCNTFPIDETTYIGVKLNTESRLGWIKISIFDKYKILILESGVQE